MRDSRDDSLVTIGLPFYNAEETLLHAIQSVFAQSHQSWELILIDDGSSDGSLKLAQSIDDPRVTTFSDGTRKGLAARLNQVAALARGEYIARMDADDLMHPERLARQVEYFSVSPDVDIVGTGMYSVDNQLRIRGKRGASPCALDPESVLSQGVFVHVSVMGRAEWFRANPYDEGFARAQDRELWCRTFGSSRYGFLDESLMFVRELGSATLKKYWLGNITHVLIIRRYGAQMVGIPRAVLMAVKAILKCVAYTVVSLTGMQACLIQSRNSEVDPKEEDVASQAVSVVIGTIVPMLAV